MWLDNLTVDTNHHSGLGSRVEVEIGYLAAGRTCWLLIEWMQILGVLSAASHREYHHQAPVHSTQVITSNNLLSYPPTHLTPHWSPVLQVPAVTRATWYPPLSMRTSQETSQEVGHGEDQRIFANNQWEALPSIIRKKSECSICSICRGSVTTSRLIINQNWELFRIKPNS